METATHSYQILNDSEFTTTAIDAANIGNVYLHRNNFHAFQIYQPIQKDKGNNPRVDLAISIIEVKQWITEAFWAMLWKMLSKYAMNACNKLFFHCACTYNAVHFIQLIPSSGKNITQSLSGIKYIHKCPITGINVAPVENGLPIEELRKNGMNVFIDTEQDIMK